MKNKVNSLTAVLLLVTGQLIYAGSATWSSNPTNSDWGNPANWTPNAVPNGPNDRATFGISNITDVSLPATATQVNTIGFDYHGDPFTLTVGATGQGTFHITGSGIANASNKGQTFVIRTPYTEGLAFYNAASAGLTTFTVENASAIGFHDNTDANFAYFTVSGGDGSEGGGSQLNFYDSASASNGYNYVTTGGSAPSAEGGTISFYGNSSGGNSYTTNKAATDPDAASGGTLNFYDYSTAGTSITNESGPVTGGLQNRGSTTFWDNSVCFASIICNGAQSANDASAAVEFFDNSSSNGFLVANGGSHGGEGGLIRFSDSSSGGETFVELSGNGTLDITNLATAGLHLGELEGAGGIVLLGTHNISLGGGFVASQFDGVIEGSGSLTKVGSSTITLTGANTYTGGTVIIGGFLRVDNKRGSATGSGAVQVSSATLGGGGIIAGPVTVGTSSRRSASVAPGNGMTTLTLQSTLTFETRGSYVWRIRPGGPTSDKLVANGVTIKSGAQIQAIGHGTLTTGAGLTAIENTSSNAITGTFANLPDGGTLTIGNNTLQASYEGGDGNDLTLTVVP